jgi:hypothetical protein
LSEGAVAIANVIKPPIDTIGKIDKKRIIFSYHKLVSIVSCVLGKIAQ